MRCMLYFLSFFLYISLFAAEVSVDSLAMQAAYTGTFGTGCSRTLAKIASNPHEFWEERKAFLSNKKISHDTFCRQYVNDAELLMAKVAQNFALPNNLKENDRAVILDLVRKRAITLLTHVQKSDDPISLTACAIFYANLCENLYKATEANPEVIMHAVEDCKNFAANFAAFMQNYEQRQKHFPHERIVWLTNPEARSSLWDSLVLLSQGHFAYTAKTPAKGGENLVTQLSVLAYNGAILISSFNPALRQIAHEKTLHRAGVSSKHYLLDCLSKQNLITGNLPALARQVQAIYCNFRETVLLTNSHSLEKLVFPDMMDHIGQQFYAIAPPVFRTPMEQPQISDVTSALITWRNQYCRDVGEVHLKIAQSRQRRDTLKANSIGTLALCFGVCVSCIPGCSS